MSMIVQRGTVNAECLVWAQSTVYLVAMRNFIIITLKTKVQLTSVSSFPRSVDLLCRVLARLFAPVHQVHHATMHGHSSMTLLASRCACAAAQHVGAQAQYSSLAATTTQALSLVHRPDAQLIGATGRCRNQEMHNGRAWTAHRHQATASAPASKVGVPHAIRVPRACNSVGDQDTCTVTTLCRKKYCC